MLVLPAGASAGTARLRLASSSEPRDTTVYAYSEYIGAPGERNDVTVRNGDGYGVVFHDASAPVHVNGCEQIDDHTARCVSPDYASRLTSVMAGDGDDRITDIDAYAYMYGEDGDDTLVNAPGGYPFGGRGDDVLKGSATDDMLTGGAGSDHLIGGDGDDTLIGDGPGAKPAADVVDGGPGVDSASYRERVRPVVADLRRSGRQGAAGEGDSYRGVEGVVGGVGADSLTGNGGPNVLQA